MKSRIQKEFNDHVATAKFTLDSITDNLEKAVGIYTSEWGEDKIFKF